jgi:parvulin-like peptidyl-prolyl isomerase
MFTVNRCAPVVAVLLACVGLSACGGGGSAKTTVTQSAAAQPTQATATAQPTAAQRAAERIAVVRVGANTITKATVDHWVSIKTPKSASYEPLSRGACSTAQIEFERNSSKATKGNTRPTIAQLKRSCEQALKQTIKKQVLNSLLVFEWEIQEAARDGLRVTDSEAMKQLEEDKHNQFSSEAAFQKYLNTSGRTVADLLLSIKSRLATERIFQMIKDKAGNVTQAEIAQYYSTHKQHYFMPERRDIQSITTFTKPAIENAEKEVRSGVSFADVAKRVSIDRSNNERGGMTLGIVRGQGVKSYDEAIFGAKPHALTGPLSLHKQYYIFEVNRIIPARQQPFAEIEASIKQQLPAELQQQARVQFVKAWRKRWTAQTDCSPGYVVQKCRQFKASLATPRKTEDPYTLN